MAVGRLSDSQGEAVKARNALCAPRTVSLRACTCSSAGARLAHPSGLASILLERWIDKYIIDPEASDRPAGLGTYVPDRD